MPGRLKNGNPTGAGGRRAGSGRKTSEFKDKCAALSGSKEYFEWAARVLSGEATEVKITQDGSAHRVPASTGDRVFLWKTLAAYGHGMPTQPISGDPDNPIFPLPALLKKIGDERDRS